jgi:hypothetical protein
MNVITEARITAQPKDWTDPMPRVYITIGGTEMFLYEYYPDEITLTADEFVGLTLEQSLTLKGKKDRAYLQS